MNDATDALLLSILKRAALVWIEAARFTWQALRAMWRITWSMRVEVMNYALEDARRSLRAYSMRVARANMDVFSAIEALSQAMNK